MATPNQARIALSSPSAENISIETSDIVATDVIHLLKMRLNW